MNKNLKQVELLNNSEKDQRINISKYNFYLTKFMLTNLNLVFKKYYK